MRREQTTIRLPGELKEKLQQEAAKMGISFNAYILLLIDKGHQYLR
ncbi:toxin-antitoxin system HicB family antitoxin [Enterocloster citroniae]